MKTHGLNLFLIVLVCILSISLALSCEGTSSQNNEYAWDDCPGKILADNIATRLDDLPSGWYLQFMQSLPSLQDLFSLGRGEAWVTVTFADGKPWTDRRRSVTSFATLHWEEEAVMYYFHAPDGWDAINITGVDEAYITMRLTQVGEPAVNCTSGVNLKFRKGLYEVDVQSYNQDLEDLCIQEGEEVDAEIGFVIDLATKVASRIS